MFNHTEIPAAEPITLKGILDESGQLFVVFAAGAAERIVAAELDDVFVFENFRRHVLEQLDLRVVYRGGRWFSDVIEAAERGGVTVKVDHAAKIIWFDQRPLAFAEAGYVAELLEVEAAGAA